MVCPRRETFQFAHVQVFSRTKIPHVFAFPREDLANHLAALVFFSRPEQEVVAPLRKRGERARVSQPSYHGRLESPKVDHGRSFTWTPPPKQFIAQRGGYRGEGLGHPPQRSSSWVLPNVSAGFTIPRTDLSVFFSEALRLSLLVKLQHPHLSPTSK